MSIKYILKNIYTFEIMILNALINDITIMIYVRSGVRTPTTKKKITIIKNNHNICHFFF